MESPSELINAAHHVNRQRLTTVSEYHYYLYYRSLDNLMCMTGIEDTCAYEGEPNKLAPATLMPQEAVLIAVSRCDLEGAAEMTTVSTATLRWRRPGDLRIPEGMMA